MKNEHLADLTKQLTHGFAQGGWDSLTSKPDAAAEHEIQQQQLEAQLKIYEEMAEIAAPFMTPAGALALERIKKRLYEPPTFQMELLRNNGIQGEANIQYGFWREGQRSSYLFILQAIEIAKQGPPTLNAEA